MSGGSLDCLCRIVRVERRRSNSARDVDEQATTRNLSELAFSGRPKLLDGIDVAALRAHAGYEHGELRDGVANALKLFGSGGTDHQPHVFATVGPLRRAPRYVHVQRVAVDIKILDLACAGVRGATENEHEPILALEQW
jgi:hypothetical protein